MHLKKNNMGQCGFSLVEILVAVVILSVGLLGLAGLQTTSLKNNDDAYLRSQATMLAYSMLDHMRANHDGTISNDYDVAFADTAPAQDCIANNCTHAQLAKADLEEWLDKLAKTLPEGDGEITTTPVDTMTKVVVTVRWYSHFGANDTQTVVLSSDL